MLSSMAAARARHLPGAEVERAAIGEARVAHAQRDGAEGRARPARRASCEFTIRFIAALPVEHHLARAVAGHRGEAHRLQQRAEGLRLRGGVLDELDAVHAQRVAGLGNGVGGGAAAHHATSRRKCASIRAASASRPVKSLKAPMAWPTFMWPPSTVAQPMRRAAFSNAVSRARRRPRRPTSRAAASPRAAADRAWPPSPSASRG